MLRFSLVGLLRQAATNRAQAGELVCLLEPQLRVGLPKQYERLAVLLRRLPPPALGARTVVALADFYADNATGSSDPQRWRQSAGLLHELLHMSMCVCMS